MSLFKTSGLTSAQEELLNKWTYDEPSNRMSTDASVRSGLNSFELGEMHTEHSGGENVFWQNNVSGINWFPTWQGVKPYVNINTHMGLSPTLRMYSMPKVIYPNGSIVSPLTTIYTDEVTLFENESVFKLAVKAGEAYTGKLFYTLRDTTQSGLIKYQQIIDVDIVYGDDIVFNFTHPSESMGGDIIAVDMLKEDGTPILLQSTSTYSGTKPYIELTLNSFEDINIKGGTKFLTESTTVHYPIDYEVDVSGTASGVTVTVPSDFTSSFSVSDANQTFSPTKPCNVDFSAFGQGVAVLQSSRDSYKFFYDTSANQWRYKDIDTKNGGVV